MVFQILFEAKSQKYLKTLRNKDQERIFASIQELTSNPYAGKALLGKLAGVCSLRVWPYRILYKIYKDKVIIVIPDIGHRQGVYK